MTLTVEISDDSVARILDMGRRSHRTFNEVLENLLQKFANEMVYEPPLDDPDYDPEDSPTAAYEARIAALSERIPPDVLADLEKDMVPPRHSLTPEGSWLDGLDDDGKPADERSQTSDARAA